MITDAKGIIVHISVVGKHVKDVAAAVLIHVKTIIRCYRWIVIIVYRHRYGCIVRFSKRIFNGVGKSLVTHKVQGRLIRQICIVVCNRSTLIRRNTYVYNCQNVAVVRVYVYVVGKHIQIVDALFLNVIIVIHSIRIIVHRRDSNGHSCRLTVFDSVVGTIGKGVNAVEVVFRVINKGPFGVLKQIAVAWEGLHFHCQCITHIRITVITQHTRCYIHVQPGIFLSFVIRVIYCHRWLVYCINGNAHRCSIRTAVAVTYLIYKRIAGGLSIIVYVLVRAVSIEGQNAVADVT